VRRSAKRRPGSLLINGQAAPRPAGATVKLENTRLEVPFYSAMLFA
jgi:hypothetical protein